MFLTSPRARLYVYGLCVRVRERAVPAYGSGDNASAAAQEVEDLQSKLREKDKALIKLQKEHKRLQVMAAGRSPAALRTPGAW